jgi:hypothetical protein
MTRNVKVELNNLDMLRKHLDITAVFYWSVIYCIHFVVVF